VIGAIIGTDSARVTSYSFHNPAIGVARRVCGMLLSSICGRLETLAGLG
jgi:hypothetical protein